MDNGSIASSGNELKAWIPGAPCEMAMGDDGKRCKCKARRGGFKNPKPSCLCLGFGRTVWNGNGGGGEG